LSKPQTEIGILAVQEEPLVEAFDALKRAPADTKSCPTQPLRLARLLISVSHRLGRPSGSASQVVEEERFAESRKQPRIPTHRKIGFARGIQDSRADGAAAGVRIESFGKDAKVGRRDRRVGIEKEDGAPPADPRSHVAGRTEPSVASHVDDLSVEPGEQGSRIFRARVVHHDYAYVVKATERLDRCPEVLRAAIGDNDDVDRSHRIGARSPLPVSVWSTLVAFASVALPVTGTAARRSEGLTGAFVRTCQHVVTIALTAHKLSNDRRMLGGK
jgi:hypothetical protein